MNVVHLSTYDVRGGAARAAYRQHRALLEAGVESRMLVRLKESDDDTVLCYKPPSSPWVRLNRVSRRIMLSRTAARRPRVVLTDDRSDVTGDILGDLRPDVVNMHYATGFVDYPSFFARYSSHLPTVVTMHDMWPFTGGCHYAGQCDGYEIGCGTCPALETAREADLSRIMWQRKSGAYALACHDGLTFVSNSHWLADRARQSGLLRSQRIETIHLGVDTRIFRPGPRCSAKEALGLAPSEVVVLFGAANVADRRKGFLKMKEAIKGSASLGHCVWVSVGRGHVRLDPGLRHYHLGHVESDFLLATIYRAADVFVMPSLEEAFGQTALEATACGTPVVAFAAGGIPEVVRHEVNGLMCEPGDVTALRDLLEEMAGDAGLRERLGSAGPGIAEREFSYARNACNYLDLYESVVGAGVGGAA